MAEREFFGRVSQISKKMEDGGGGGGVVKSLAAEHILIYRRRQLHQPGPKIYDVKD